MKVVICPNLMEYRLVIVAIRHVQPMPGGSQSHLMACDDGNLWVVKFINNPQRPDALANELIVNRIAKCIGLSVPQSEFIYVSQALIRRNVSMRMSLASGKTVDCADGIQFGSRFIGSLQSNSRIAFLSRAQLLQITNLAQFAGILALDVWVNNEDQRQAVFSSSPIGRKRAFFIDHGQSLGHLDIESYGARCLTFYGKTAVYSKICCLHSFEPWLSRIEQVSLAKLLRTVDGMPESWYPGRVEALGSMFKNLLIRKSFVRNAIALELQYQRENFRGLSECRLGGCPGNGDRSGCYSAIFRGPRVSRIES